MRNNFGRKPHFGRKPQSLSYCLDRNRMYGARGYAAVIFMIVPSNFSSVNELSADLRAYSYNLLFKY